MDELRYEAPETLDAAVALLAGADGDARILAGGTDVLVLLHCDMIEPGLLVDIKKIPELTSIAIEAGGFLRSALSLAKASSMGLRSGE